MKSYLLLAVCLILAGCSRREQNQREILIKLESIKSELATKRGETVRWAFANKREIDSAIFQWSRGKMEELKQSEGLSSEIEAKVLQYEALQSDLTHKQMEKRGFRLPPRLTAAETPAADEDIEVLSKRVAEMKAPIADILERRARKAAQFRDQYSTDKLVAEYVKDRFDLIVDSSDEHLSRTAVLYRTTGEALDITDGVMKLFQQKTTP